MNEPLPTRSEQPPDDALIVIRAGIMDSGNVERATTQCFERYGLYAISIEAVIDMTVDEVCRTCPRLSQYRQVRLSTFGRLRAGPFALLATFDATHYSVVLPDLSDLTIPRLVRCFDDPMPNPGLARSR
ncbi:MAG: hypothetical protein ACRD29_08170 [Acidimicrobiales bacterium]